MDDEIQEILEKEIEEIIDSRMPFVYDIYTKIRYRIYNTYQWPELDPIRNEICLCLMFGLSQASITLTNHLMESVLKYVLIEKHSKDETPPRKGKAITDFVRKFADALGIYDNSDLNKNINKSCSLGLITKEQKKLLHKFRINYRNAYSHSEKGKTFGNRTVPMQALKIEDGKIVMDEQSQPKIAKMLVGQGLIQAKIAEKEGPDYFIEVDNIVRHIRDKLYNYEYIF